MDTERLPESGGLRAPAAGAGDIKRSGNVAETKVPDPVLDSR